jgi:trigger factor
MRRRILTIMIATVAALSMVACTADGDRVLSNDYIIIHKHQGLEVTEIEQQEITEDEVEHMIQMELMQRVIHNDITDRPARVGDMVTIDFAGSVDGVFFPGGSAEGSQLHLGSGAFIGPYGDYGGFEEQIVGHRVGDEFDIVVQFPEDYHAPDLAGDVATFNITLHGITETIIPELTDEWVSENSRESATIAEYREEIEKQIADSRRMEILFRQQHEVFAALMEHVEVIEIPTWAIEEEVAMQESIYRNMATSQGIEFDVFLQQVLGVDEEMFREQVMSFAEETATMQLAIDLIKEENNISLSDEEMTRRIKELALLSGMDSAEDYLDRFGSDVVHATIIQLRVAEFLIEHAEFVER